MVAKGQVSLQAISYLKMKQTHCHHGKAKHQSIYFEFSEYFRRRVIPRGSEVNDPIHIEPAILSALQLYMESDVEEVSCLIAKFLHLFITGSPFLEAHEIDNFILRNGKLITIW
jgi:hypothetical protein